MTLIRFFSTKYYLHLIVCYQMFTAMPIFFYAAFPLVLWQMYDLASAETDFGDND